MLVYLVTSEVTFGVCNFVFDQFKIGEKDSIIIIDESEESPWRL